MLTGVRGYSDTVLSISIIHLYSIVVIPEELFKKRLSFWNRKCGNGWANVWLPGQLSASLAVMLLLQEEQSVVADTVREVNRWPLLDLASLSRASLSRSFSRSFSLFCRVQQKETKASNCCTNVQHPHPCITLLTHAPLTPASLPSHLHHPPHPCITPLTPASLTSPLNLSPTALQSPPHMCDVVPRPTPAWAFLSLTDLISAWLL